MPRVEPQDHIVEAVEPRLAFGTYGVTQGFLPLLTSSPGAIVNNVSMMAPAPLPITPAYAISKAAAFQPDSIAARPSITRHFWSETAGAILVSIGSCINAQGKAPSDFPLEALLGRCQMNWLRSCAEPGAAR